MKTTQTFSMRFITLPKKSNPEEAFIYARITISKKVIDISLKRTVACSLWDSKCEGVTSRTPEAKQTNKFIDDTRYRLMEYSIVFNRLPQHQYENHFGSTK